MNLWYIRINLQKWCGCRICSNYVWNIWALKWHSSSLKHLLFCRFDAFSITVIWIEWCFPRFAQFVTYGLKGHAIITSPNFNWIVFFRMVVESFKVHRKLSFIIQKWSYHKLQKIGECFPCLLLIQKLHITFGKPHLEKNIRRSYVWKSPLVSMGARTPPPTRFHTGMHRSPPSWLGWIWAGPGSTLTGWRGQNDPPSAEEEKETNKKQFKLILEQKDIVIICKVSKTTECRFKHLYSQNVFSVQFGNKY